MSNLTKIIGKNIRKIRYERSMTQLDLASLSDCACGYISEVENGLSKISLEKFISLSINMGMNPSKLLYLIMTDEENSENNSENDSYDNSNNIYDN